MMYNILQIAERIKSLCKAQLNFDIQFTTNNLEHGDLCTNAPMILSKKMNAPINVAFETLYNIIYTAFNNIDNIDTDAKIIDSIELANGFCNIKFSSFMIKSQVHSIISSGNYGKSAPNNIKVNIEYVSPNPTGPIHIGHLRSVYADVLANILAFNGYDITRECYINDMGNQIHDFEKSVMHKYNALHGVEDHHECAYKGAYIDELAQTMYELRDEAVPFIDQLIQLVVQRVKHDLSRVGIHHDVYVYESKIYQSGLTQEAFDLLKSNNLIQHQELGDVKSRRGAASGHAAYTYTPSNTEISARQDTNAKVLFRHDMSPTYFANDLGYELDKIHRQYKKIIILYGADHIGQIAWMKAAFKDLVTLGGYDAEFIPIAYEVVTLKKNGEHFKMSKRSGVFVSADDVINSLDDPLILRFFMIYKGLNTAYCIDVEELSKISKENKFFYIQYAYARASSILRTHEIVTTNASNIDIAHLTKPMLTLLRYIIAWPLMIHDIGQAMNPQALIHYTEQLSEYFHQVWTDGNNDQSCKIVMSDTNATMSRLILVQAFQQVMNTCMQIIGINAYEVLK